MRTHQCLLCKQGWEHPEYGECYDNTAAVCPGCSGVTPSGFWQYIDPLLEFVLEVREGWMAQRKLYEAEADGNSVIIWQGANGTRVVYPTEQAAEIAAGYLINKANEFHAAVEANEGVQSVAMVTVICYGDVPMTGFAFAQNYLERVRKAGLEVQQGLQRESKEFW